MDIAIFGAGVAGLMTAIALRAQGHRCHIYERMRQGHETGMGFILMPEGIDPAVLAERSRWLSEIAKRTGFRMTPRLHIDLWGNRRGV